MSPARRWLRPTRKSSGARLAPRNRRDQGAAGAAPGGAGVQERGQVAGQRRLVGERPLLGLGLDEEVERVDDRDLGDEIDLDLQRPRQLGEHHPRQVVAVRILLPVQEVRLGRDAQRVAEDRRPAVRRRPQPDGLRRQRDRPVVAVAGAVGEGDVNGHAAPGWTRPSDRMIVRNGAARRPNLAPIRQLCP